jgi:SAM-dependent methyltransferase
MIISQAALRDRATRFCPTCASFSATHLWDNKLELIDNLDMSYKVGSCSECGFVYAYHLSAPDTFARYYSSLSKYDFSEGEYSESAVDILRSNAAISICEAYVHPDCQMADIGCGLGYLLSCFRKHGYQRVWGIDPGPSSPRSASRCFGLENVYTGSISETSSLIPISDINLVTLTGVLEHLWDIRSDLLGLVSSMKPGSYILVEVPALENFDAINDEPFGELSLEHIHFFSVRSLNRFMHSVGLSCVQNKILPLPAGTADSLFGLYRISGNPSQACIPSEAAAINSEAHAFTKYLTASSLIYAKALEKIPLVKFCLYGAGSHTARLLANLTPYQRERIVAIVDSNPNFTGKLIGKWKIYPPSALSDLPSVPIVVSSYRAQVAISRHIRQYWGNPIVLLYDIGNDAYQGSHA